MSAFECVCHGFCAIESGGRLLAPDVTCRKQNKSELDRLRAELEANRKLNAIYAKDAERLRAELADTKADYLRRHKDAGDRYEEIIRLRAEVARQWQPIETAPLDVKWLLTWDGSHYHIATRLGWTGMKPTHWMPLPAPPGKEE